MISENFRYRLNSKLGKFTCPECGESKRFSRFEDTQTGELLPEEYGICDRENSCGYFLSPYHKDEDGSSYAKKIWFQERQTNKSNSNQEHQSKPTKNMETPISLLPDEKVLSTDLPSHKNHLLNYIKNRFNEEQVIYLKSQYYIGTMPNGDCVFYQADKQGLIRGGKIMSYNEQTGRRIKSMYGQSTINWVHSEWKLQNYHLKQCFFGEHLLGEYPGKPVAVVESEKTAMIACIYLPNFLWLATGGSQGLTDEKCQVLKGRHVILFPDLSPDGSTFAKWAEKGQKFDFTTSDLLETKATTEERQQSLDIADYLLGYDHLMSYNN